MFCFKQFRLCVGCGWVCVDVMQAYHRLCCRVLHTLYENAKV